MFLRGNGKGAWFGWPDAPKIEALRTPGSTRPDLAAQKKIGVEMQLQAFDDVPYIPLGPVLLSRRRIRKDITGVLDGFVKFWNVRKT